MDGTLTLRPSRRLLVAGVLMHAMALLAMTLSALPALWWPVAGAGLLTSLWRFLMMQYRPRFTVIRLRDGVVGLEAPAGMLAASSPDVRLMLPGMVLLRFRFRRAGHRQRSLHLLLTPDSLRREEWRALHRYLGGWSAGEVSV